MPEVMQTDFFDACFFAVSGKDAVGCAISKRFCAAENKIIVAVFGLGKHVTD